MSSCLKLCSFEHCKLRTLPSLKLSIYYQNDWRTRKYFLLKVPLYYELLVCKKKGAVRKEVGYFQILKKRDAVPEIRLEREEFWKKRNWFSKVGGLHNLFLSWYQTGHHSLFPWISSFLVLILSQWKLFFSKYRLLIIAEINNFREKLMKWCRTLIHLLVTSSWWLPRFKKVVRISSEKGAFYSSQSQYLLFSNFWYYHEI